MKVIRVILLTLLSYSGLAQTISDVSEDVNELKDSIDSLKNKLNNLSDKSIKFGLSVGYRRLRSKFQSDYQSASISPIDGTLQLEDLSRDAFVISTSVVFTPFIKADWIAATKSGLDRYRVDIKKEISTKREIDKSEKSKRKGLGNKRLERYFLLARKSVLEALSNIGVQANINLIDFTEAQENFTFNKAVEGGLGLSYRLSDKIYFSAHYELFFSRQLRQSIKDRVGQVINDSNGNPITEIGQIDIDDDNFYITKNVLGFVYRIIVVF